MRRAAPPTPESTAPGVRAQQREATRRRVYEAALQVFRRDGVQGSRIEDIVALAGVSSGTFYFHFTTKEDVLAQLIRESSARVAVKLEQLPPRKPLRAVLQAASSAVAAEWRNDRRMFLDAGMVALRLMAAQDHSPDPVYATLAPRFEAAAARGELAREAPPALLAEFFLLELFAGALAACASPDLDLDVVLSGVARLFLDGARARRR